VSYGKKSRKLLSLLKEMVKGAMEGVMEERVGYLEENPRRRGMGIP
jgi:hypothetical protein